MRPVDVNRSDWDCTLELGATAGAGPALRLGLCQVKGLAERDGEWLVAARGNGYREVAALWHRAGLGGRALENLARADAFGSLGLGRREALWAVRGLAPILPDGRAAADKRPPLPLFAAMGAEETGEEPPVVLPAMTLGAEVVADYSALRLSLKAHPCALLRSDLGGRGAMTGASLAARVHGERATAAGVVLVRQRPGSARGVIFVTLEDETGVANVVVWPDVFERFRRIVLTARLMLVRGRLQREGIVIHVVAEELVDLSGLLDGLSAIDGFAPAYSRGDHVTHPSPPDARERPPRRPAAATSRLRHPRDQAKAIFPSRDFH